MQVFMVLTVGLGAIGIAPALANEIYNRLAPATVLFYDLQPDGTQDVGSGVLIDADKKLVLTVEHVVKRFVRDGSFKTSVMFPMLDKAGKVDTNATVYKKKRDALSIPGEIIYVDHTKDLAIIRLDRVPAGVKAVPLATAEVEPGDRLHVVGNSTFFDGGAFDYCAGEMRNQFYMNKTSVRPAGIALRDVVFFTLANDIPTNPGDSGGPTVNTKGELVALVSRGTPDGANRTQVLDTSVHHREIRRALDGIQQPGGNTLEVSASLDTRGFDSFFLPVTKGSNFSAKLKGQGTTDLDLHLKDITITGELWTSADGKKYTDYGHVLASTGPTDEEQISGSVAWAGLALVQVQNVGAAPGGDANKYNLTVNWSPHSRSPFTFIRKLAAKGADTIKFSYQAGKGKARVSVRGDGDVTLQMEVVDPKGVSVGKTQSVTGYHDLHSITWEPATSGIYTVQINNSGNVWSEYVFTTD
jgi:S1-C subfamily serine protease